ncbi:unnamed protein product [Arabis nemorensis]|uniref:PGG domain-containing protein n=1 Tax=Arabis nemorensis TaxID=586526 RepID=A0A565BMV5_9BRAS|nr:unnamed protein product [Arabis nemorensis]
MEPHFICKERAPLVQEIVPHTFIEAENKLGQKPHDIFMKEHKKLRIEGERWMKETAKAYIIIATLMIATVFFATLLPLPGGLDDLTGKLKFGQKKRFDVFFSADMFGILFALVSTGFFAAIKSSRFAQEDFRTNLPTKLMVGVLGLV